MITEAKQAAAEILEQLGGRRFMAMTGAKNLVYSEADGNWLSMHIPRNKSGAKYLKIVLNGMDVYTMIFSKTVKKYETLGGRKFCIDEKQVIVRSIGGVYCDQLQKLFTEVTGLYTHL
jgi:hypothetical protein